MRAGGSLRERGSLILLQSAIVLLLALVLLLAYPAIRSILADSAERDLCALQQNKRGAESLDTGTNSVTITVPGGTVVCP